MVQVTLSPRAMVTVVAVVAAPPVQTQSDGGPAGRAGRSRTGCRCRPGRLVGDLR